MGTCRCSGMLQRDAEMLGRAQGCSGGLGAARGGYRRVLGAGAGGGSWRGGEGQHPRGGGAAGAALAMEIGSALNGSAAAGRSAAAGTAALGALMVLLIAVTVAGNALVMLAFVADSSLRTQSNFFLLNLAISDFLVGKVPPAGRSRRRHCPAAARLLLPGCSPGCASTRAPLLSPDPLSQPPVRSRCPLGAGDRSRGSPGAAAVRSPSLTGNGPLRLQVLSAFPCTCPMC